MTEISIQRIEKDIEAYREAIRNAEGALAEAELCTRRACYHDSAGKAETTETM